MIKKNSLAAGVLLRTLISPIAFLREALLCDTLTKPKLVARQFHFTEGSSVEKRELFFY
jgi:hypothetical protein